MSATAAAPSPVTSPISDGAELRAYLRSPPPHIPTTLDVTAAPDSAQSVLIIQHSERVPPAYVAYFLLAQRVPFHVLTIDVSGARLPPVSQPWRCIVSLGGPQGAYEEEAHPWIASEKAFLRAHTEQGTPILAICLGAQMLAGALGGRCYAAPPEQFQVGYVPVRLTNEGVSDPMLARVFDRLALEAPDTAEVAADDDGEQLQAATGDAANWRTELGTPHTGGFLMHHGDIFDLPPSIPVLAQTAGFKQSFRHRNALAVQFHPEAGLHEISCWTAWNPDRYPRVGTTAEKLVEEVTRRRQVAEAHSKIFFEEWWRSMGFKLREEQQEAEEAHTQAVA